ncbi:hypothetical protein Patl1_24175 [Pistacia atlantica]|uniref:Uncharacterized protein n=1 Tax=Pistacia atlantica TaxID=434234 RepID=A0ACC0ZYR0_9ROSI|nr:hypothetical protein Patl1_24175 [Pistacia atlantica]
MATVKRIKLGSQELEIPAQGLGCMGMSAFYGHPKPQPEMISYVRAACEGSLKRLDVDCIDLYYIHHIDIQVPIEITLEWSLWARDVEEEIVPTCRELGIGFVAYNPLGRGFLSAGPKLLENISKDDFRQGDDVCPIPGTTKMENFNQNIKALSVKLTPEEMAELESIASVDAKKGDRDMYSYASYKNSETPPLSSWKAA